MRDLREGELPSKGVPFSCKVLGRPRQSTSCGEHAAPSGGQQFAEKHVPKPHEEIGRERKHGGRASFVDDKWALDILTGHGV
jgi:hypothetical protein